MGFVGKRPSRMQEQWFSCFRAGLKKSQAEVEISREGCPHLDLTSLKICEGDSNVPLKLQLRRRMLRFITLIFHIELTVSMEGMI